MIWLFTLLPKTLCIICKFVKIDHVETWKISYQQSLSFSQALKRRPFTEYFRAINLTFGYFHCSFPAKKWKCRHGQ